MGSARRTTRTAKIKKVGPQVDTLKHHFDCNPDWNKAFMRILADQTGLKVAQIYKWNWDQKRRRGAVEEDSEALHPNYFFVSKSA